MDEHRDRSSGWKHAKLSGHSNEELVCQMLHSDKTQQERLVQAIGIENATFISCDYGGLHETNVPSILGGTTKDKADLIIYLSDKSEVGISLKKSLAGQVFLIRDTNFIQGFELQYEKTIPDSVKRAIALFWGSADDTISIINNYSNDPAIKKYELHKHRLTAQTLKRYNASLADELIDWFKDNIYDITDYCFARGQALKATDRATIIWYINLLGEHDVDAIYHIDALCELAEKHQDLIQFGTRGGGTTITLPFGFVQWHQAQMQFHHQYKMINQLTEINLLGTEPQ